MKKKAASIGQVITLIVVIGVIIGGIFLITMKTRANKAEQENNTVQTEADKIIAIDLSSAEYPVTARAVLKLYTRILKCYFNEEVTDADVEGLVKQQRMLYDDELLSEDSNSYENMCLAMKAEISEYNLLGKTISNSVIDSAANVNEYVKDGKNYIRLCASYTTKQGSYYVKVYEEFLFRQDDSGKWKILGWREATADDMEN